MTDKTPAEEVLCPVALTLSLIGGKWKALILWNLLEGTMRYSALRKAVPDATPKMLTQQLRELEADGLVSRTVWPVVPPRVDYALTPTGESIKPILALRGFEWVSAWLSGIMPSGAPPPTPWRSPPRGSGKGGR